MAIVPGRADKLGVPQPASLNRSWISAPYPEEVTSGSGDNGAELPPMPMSSHRDALDDAYAQLAVEFNNDIADGERRAARDRYTGRPERA